MKKKEQKERIREMIFKICNLTNNQIFLNYEFLMKNNGLEDFFKLIEKEMNHIKKQCKKAFSEKNRNGKNGM